MDLYLTMNNQKESAQLMERNNSDTIINKQGKELLDLVNSAHLVITNGRVPGDLSGHLTCHKYNGSSVVDYCIVSNAIFKNVISMQVYPHEWYSDHSPIGVSMRIKEQVVNKKISHEKNSYSYKYKWEFDSETKFKTEINQHHQEFQNFCEKSFPDINDAVKNFDNILNKIAAASLKTVKINYCNKKKKTEYDTNCQTLKSEFKKIETAVEDRILKANRAIYMVKQALSTDANINCSLTMNIFQKQILPILTYGCAIWGLPKENNYIYLTGLKECTEYKDIIYKYIDKKNILFCKRVGKITQLPRKVLIKCSSFAIKENLFRLNALDENNVPFHVENYNLSFNEKCDKMHASYCKFVLNLDKFTSNFAARAELGSFPISLFIWTTCIKYWHRMEKGNCPNTLLNKTYLMNKECNSQWYQNIESLLKLNGLGNEFINPNKSENTKLFGIKIKSRLQDQYLQTWNDRMSSYEKHGTLNLIKTDKYMFSSYLNIIKDHNIRTIFTKFRLGIFNKNFGNHRNIIICPHCKNESSNFTSHILLSCLCNQNERNKLFSLLSNKYSLFNHNKLSFILNVGFTCIKGANHNDIDSLQHICNYIKLSYSYFKI